ncbi:hypothetical protein CEP54_014057 [Fusarium duplospermum]|uniref:Uncharacterized protein n=1 Tax=Fusarium duplospermum TaxID=1325734 RepID=A0A428NYQ1_9HYPO|nr:hypothetical protein CEP54_014057 [Fusarium duplospermum]
MTSTSTSALKTTPDSPNSPPPAEVHVHRQTLHQTGIKFSVQTGPCVDPLPLELYISPDTLDDSRDAIDRSQFTLIRLSSPLAVSSGCALKRRTPNEPGDDQVPVKRRHIDTPFDLQDSPVYEVTDQHLHGGPWDSFDIAQLPDSSLRPVDWSQQGIEINIAIATIPRIVLLGEVSQEEPAWRCQPGLRPDSGPLHSLRMPNNLTHDDEIVVPHPDFDSALTLAISPGKRLLVVSISRKRTLYKIFVGCVLETILRDLDMIADHGPPSFRFTRGFSTQFRWSTSSNRLMPPHASSRPASTVPGMPPMTALAKLGRDITKSLELVWMTEQSFVRDLKFEFLGASRITAAAMVAHLSRLRDQHRDGSDQQRIDCMFPHITIDLIGSPSATWSTRLRPEGLTDIPSEIPREYLERVFEAHEAGISRSRSFAESASATSSTSSSPPACASSLLYTATDWSWAQADNGTARTLANILDISLEMDLWNPSRVGEPDDSDYSSHLFRPAPYTDAVEDVCRKLEELDERIQQVLRSMKEHDWPRTRKAVTRLQDVAPFLNEIARIRICEMDQRARRGLTLLQETD